ncbi:hypothetical protein PV735_11315 [Streptomyces turgidiscabies]|uniref:Uncharacterized protein n=1 Tax=Streptomyces turgidiscabies (strain Car8) TaxID=698760 RepID=L7ETL2_STRT8|nr:hypothetical protein [Streptomyces turgidiscabies]ELP61735.1 hypothetical protein STRTUCAR8_06440 [Streptomyces turgidiscabies Car8]MDX3493273.1 hypothetical protein [Streptomyces turgidiscabies]GAQ70573.1 hypothetical protein T45_02309 [Streptomyces turgidiscabies]
MPATIEAPRSATEAAHLLAKTGAHVHLVSDGHSTCVRATCGPKPVLIPAAVREHARLYRIALGFEIRRI